MPLGWIVVLSAIGNSGIGAVEGVLLCRSSSSEVAWMKGKVVWGTGKIDSSAGPFSTNSEAIDGGICGTVVVYFRFVDGQHKVTPFSLECEVAIAETP